jgi:hypothetical protein
MIAAIALAFRFTDGKATSALARRELEQAVRHSEQGHADLAALHAAEAFTDASRNDPLHPTYALASLHASLAIPPPLVLPRPDYYEPRVIGPFVMLSGPGKFPTLIHRPGRPTLTLPPLARGSPIAISDDGRWIAATVIDDRGKEQSLIFDGERPVSAWVDAPRGSEVRFNSDGTLIIGRGSDEVRVWSRAPCKLVRSIAGPSRWATEVSTISGAEHLLLRDASAVEITDLRSGAVRRLEHPTKVQAAQFSGDGRRVATSDETGVVRLWDAASGRLEKTSGDHRSMFIADVSTDGAKILGLDPQYRIVLWDTKRDTWDSSAAVAESTGEAERGPYDIAARLWFVASDRAFVGMTPIASRSKGKAVEIWTADGRFQPAGATIPLPPDARNVEVSADGAFLTAILRDNRVRRWDLRRRFEVITALPDEEKRSPSFSKMTRDLHHALVRFPSGPMRVVDLRKRTYLDAVLPFDANDRLHLFHDRFVVRFWFVFPETQYPMRMQVLDLRTGVLIPREPLPLLPRFGVSPTGNGLRLVGSPGPDTDTGILHVSLPGGEVSAGPQTDNEAIVGFDGDTLSVWELGGGRRWMRFVIDDASVDPDIVKVLVGNSSVTVESTDQILVKAQPGATFRITRQETGIAIADAAGTPLDFPRPPHDKFVDAVFSRDGRRVILRAQPDAGVGVQVWDLVTGWPLTQPAEFAPGVVGAAFIEDDRAIAVMGSDGVVRRLYVGNATPARWLSDLAAYTTGMRLDDAGNAVMLSQEEHDAVRERLAARLRAERDDPNARYVAEQLGFK